MAEPRLKPYVPVVAQAEAQVPDRVFMHDLVLDVEIGVYTHEKGATQRVRSPWMSICCRPKTS